MVAGWPMAGFYVLPSGWAESIAIDDLWAGFHRDNAGKAIIVSHWRLNNRKAGWLHREEHRWRYCVRVTVGVCSVGAAIVE